MHGLGFRALIDIFHTARIHGGDVASQLLPLDKKVDFYFDRHSSKGAIIAAWEDYLSARSDEVRDLYGATPRFEDDRDFLPLQAADFWAWWVRKSCETGSLGKLITEGDFGLWKGEINIPSISMLCTEDHLVRSFSTILQNRSEGGTARPYDSMYWPRPLDVRITNDPTIPVQMTAHQPVGRFR